METRQSKLKRSLENNEKRKSKCSRAETPDQPMTTKIVDLNDDCLLKIFGHLDLKSLLNVAIANEWLRPAVVDVHKQKYGAKPIRILNGFLFKNTIA